MNTKLHHIYIPQTDKQFYKRHEVFELKVRNNIINKLARLLDLSHQERPIEEGNLCLANNSEVRSDYKTILTSIDVKHAVFALLKSEIINFETDEVSIPVTPGSFWKKVEQGKKLKMN